jgi:indole-3-pyruvate monooxygenase
MQIDVLIVGASVAGLACAACLHKRNIKYIIIEKENEVAKPWRNHYERLHLHTPKSLSALPYKKFDKNVPRYPGRLQVVEYLEAYQKSFNINPVFNNEALSIKKDGEFWITKTNTSIFKSKYIILATGAYGKPKPVHFKGMETFPGKILHSSDYKTGKNFKDEKVLVVGFGNSACEIAIDLYEQDAEPSMSVRSAINIVPRDLLGIPVLKISLLLLSKLPPKLADAIAAPIMRLKFGDITKLGLRKKSYGVFEQIKNDMNIPLLDIGTIKHIQEGHIKIFNSIDFIENNTVHFVDGSKKGFDAIIAAIGYYCDYANFLHVDKSRFEDLKFSINQQKLFGKDGLYFCGFWVGPTGEFREISLDAIKIAKDIAEKS